MQIGGTSLALQYNTYFNEIEIWNTGEGNDRAGIIIAPDVNPLTNSNPSLNASTTPLKVDISCSKIENCDYGIVGIGQKTSRQAQVCLFFVLKGNICTILT